MRQSCPFRSAEVSSPDLLAMLFLMCPRIPLAFVASRAHCWLSQPVDHQYTQDLLCTCLFQQISPKLYWYKCLFLLRCRTLHLPLLNLITIPSAQLCSLPRSHWTTAQPSGVSATPRFVSSHNLLRMLSMHSSSLLMKMFNKTGLSTDPVKTPTRIALLILTLCAVPSASSQSALLSSHLFHNS